MTCFKNCCALLLLPFFVSCGSETASLEDLSTFVGTWRLDEEGRNYTETWVLDGDRLDGSAVELVGTDTVFYEEMTVFERGEDGWVLGVTVADQNNSSTVFFRLLEFRKDYFQFENPNHDFPKRIIYEMKGSDRMEARVDGGEEGEQILRFAFDKVK